MDQYTNNMSRRQLRHTLDSLLEGIQVVDFDWRYLYVNDSIAQDYKGNRQDLRTLTMMDKYPGIENTEVFTVLRECMANRTPERLEIEFVHLDHTIRWFDVSIVAVDEGICIMSLDITAHKIAEEKIFKANRLYAFISQVNQNIVRIKDEAALFNNSCRIAVEYGGFKMAWVGLFDSKKTIHITDQYGVPEEDIYLFTDHRHAENSIQEYVLRNDTYFICNNVENDIKFKDWKQFCKKHDIKSCLVLPIRKSGQIIGTFNLYSTKLHFSDNQEIALLMEVAGDISYALDMFENIKKHNATEALVIKNDKRFRALIEKSADIKTLSTKDGTVLYASPSIKKVLGIYPEGVRFITFFEHIS